MGVFKRYKDAQAAQKNAENAMPGAYQSNYTDRINEALDSMGAASNAGYDVGTGQRTLPAVPRGRTGECQGGG